MLKNTKIHIIRTEIKILIQKLIKKKVHTQAEMKSLQVRIKVIKDTNAIIIVARSE